MNSENYFLPSSALQYGIALWTHNQSRRVRAGEVCDPGESEWEANVWKTKDVIQQ